jgi:hypothetical protein
VSPGIGGGHHDRIGNAARAATPSSQQDIERGDVERPSHARLKDRGIDLTVALGRLARQEGGRVPHEAIEAILMPAISAANLFRVDLSQVTLAAREIGDPLRSLADPVGRFADACEKVDHLEDFSELAKAALVDIVAWCSSAADVSLADASSGVSVRVPPATA